MWKLTIHKEPKGKLELQVSILLKGMLHNTYATYAEALIDHFKSTVVEIPKSNNFSAELMFKMTPRNQFSVELWKLFPNGDFKYKLFTIDYIK